MRSNALRGLMFNLRGDFLEVSAVFTKYPDLANVALVFAKFVPFVVEG